MKIKIETYRKFDIVFDTENEAFSSVIHQDTNTAFMEAKQLKESKSYSAVKKAIDEYIKKNNTFEPFFVRIGPLAYSYNEDKRKLKIVGIRKDGRFIGEDKRGKLIQISEYDEKDYILDRPEDESHFVKIALLEIEKDKIVKEIETVKKSIVTETLKDLKPKFIQE